MEVNPKIDKILQRFRDCELQSNEQLSASIYYAYCSLPIYDSSEKELQVKCTHSINFKSIKSDSWEIDLAENIATIFRCVVSVKAITNNEPNSRTIYTFAFVGVEDDSVIASYIFNRLYSAMIYKCKSTLKKSFDRFLGKKSYLSKSKASGLINSAKTINSRMNSELKSLVEDISDMSMGVQNNEFSDLISKYFLKESQSVIS